MSTATTATAASRLVRVEIRPRPTLQIATSRTAQWCGEDRPCGLNTFWDLLIGNDNDQALEEQRQTD